MSKQFGVIGLGRFGKSVACTLAGLDNEVLVVDKDEERINDITGSVTCAIQADATDEITLRATGISNMDYVIITVGDVQASIMIALLCKEMGIKNVVVKALNDLHAKVLYKIGADRVIFPEREMGARIAHNLVSNNVLDFIDLSPDYSLIEISAAPEWENKSLMELNFRAKYGVGVLVIKSENGINIAPAGHDIISAGDVLIVIGEKNDLKKLENINNK